jgi:CDP-glycerol glycerophosphotransferase (TagB/SpsB family)
LLKLKIVGALDLGSVTVLHTKFLFEIAEKDDSLDAYWITSNLEVYNSLKFENRKVLLSFSLKGIYIQLTSYVFLCTVNSNDFYFPCITRRNIFIQLWHGAPLKKIGFDVDYTHLQKIVNRIRSFFIDNYDYVISPDIKFDSSFMTAMGVEKSQIIRSDYPRCDSFNIPSNLVEEVREKLSIKSNEKFLFYLPTHRNEGEDIQQILIVYENFNKNNNILKEYDLKIIIKLHPYDMKYRGLFKDGCSNVQLLSEDLRYDLYQILAASDALITDYSSVMFEYELLNKKIFYFVPDLVDYSINLRGLYFPYEALIDDPIHDFDALLKLLTSDAKTNKRKVNQRLGNGEVGQISLKLIDKLKSKVFSG